MDNFYALFKHLSSIFNEHNFRLYLVGGSVRDYLLGKEFFDYDFATDATPENIKKFLPNIDLTFEKFGCVKYKENNFTFTITTFRKESGYQDYRHPSKIMFTSNIYKDSKRRDFTINALYMDCDKRILDFHHGKKDIRRKIIRTIGNSNKRLKEDPLRILRAIRFSLLLNFEISNRLSKAITKNAHLLSSLNPEKIKEEIRKCGKQTFSMHSDKLSELKVFNYIKDMLE